MCAALDERRTTSVILAFLRSRRGRAQPQSCTLRSAIFASELSTLCPERTRVGYESPRPSTKERAFFTTQIVKSALPAARAILAPVLLDV